jgi:esterase/lipase
MRGFGKWLGRILLAAVVMGGLGWALGPYEPVEVAAGFDMSRLDRGAQAYLDSAEAAQADITPGTEKRVIWAGAPEAKTPLAVLYVHGFSATSEEIRPVPDRVAAALGANLVFTRLTGHGQPGAALAQATVHDWMADMAEALAVARAVGDEVIVISTSTGGTLMAEAALQPEMARGVKGIVFISPNLGINDPMAPLLTMPAARYLLPLVAGKQRTWQPGSEAQARFWTTSYPTAAVFPMAALVAHAVAQDYSGVTIPALFYFSPRDRVVRGDLTEGFAARWGGGATVVALPEGADVSDNRHVIAGDIVSPGNTAATVQVIEDWIGGLR